jgi:hypothetical protein
VAVSLGRFGVGIYNLAAPSFSSNTESNSNFPAASVQSDVNALTTKYKNDLQQARASADVAESIGDVVIKSALVAGTASGVGAVPAALIGSAATWANTQFATTIRTTGEDSAYQILYQSVQKWNDAKGATYDKVAQMLKSGDRKDAEEAFENSTGFLTQLRDELKDTDGQQIAEDFLFGTIENTTRADILQNGKNTDDIADLSQKLYKYANFTHDFVDKTTQRLDAYKDRLSEVNDLLKSASSDVADLQTDQNVTSQQVIAIQDVFYQQQSAAGKLYLLEHGAKPELSSEQREKLETYFTAEQKQQELVADTGQFVTTVTQIKTIANNLGLHDPNIDQAINYATVAQSAFANVATGNYIGAILSVTSVFGGAKPDPEQMRFNAIMGFLKQLDQKLDEVIELQKQTLQAVQKLSVQVADLGKQLNSRFDHVDFELRRIADGFSTVMWGELVGCGVAWSERNKVPVTFDDTSREFTDTQKLTAFVDCNADDLIKCGNELRDLFVKVKDQETFGKPLSLRLAANTDFSINPADKDTTLSKSDLEEFLGKIHEPARDILIANWSPTWGHPANLFAMLASPASNVMGVRARLDELQKLAAQGKPLHACSSPTLLSWRLRSFFCTKDLYSPAAVPAVVSPAEEQTAQQVAKASLNDPIVRDQLLDLVNWSSLVARPLDFWKGTGSEVYSLDELGHGKGEQRGKDLIWGAASIFDLAIAQQAMLSGDINLEFVYDALWDKTTGSPKVIDGKSSQISQLAHALIRNANNPWLARNVLMFALTDSLRAGSGDLSLPYQDALKPFLEIADAKAPSDEKLNAGTLFMRSLFKVPDSAKFTIEDENTPTGVMRKVFINFADLRIEMPSAEMFRQRSLIYPKSVSDLVMLRDGLAEKLVDYDFLNGIKDTERKKRVAKTLFLGMANYGISSKE